MVWLCMVLYGCVWYCMVGYGIVWLGMVLYGWVWYRMVGYGMVWCQPVEVTCEQLELLQAGEGVEGGKKVAQVLVHI